ncbi:hypothetical protein KKB40_04315 [Patescibacteria group bacterium]|nr:hypothetical protein [Patescibacteria group bacterium]
MITFKDFQKLDIRIGTVIKAEVPEWSHWVIKLTVDFGGDPSAGSGQCVGERTVFAGMLGFYKPEDFLNKQFPFIVNMEPKKIGPKGDVSEGMMMATSMKLDKPVEVAGEGTFEKPVFLIPSEKVPDGTRVR